MKSAILYASLIGTRSVNPRVYAGKIPIFIRVETVDADPLHALEQAKPMPHETVLNTIPLEN